MIPLEKYAIYLVTDEPSRYKGDFVEAVEEAIDGGVTLVQYRDTESSGRIMYERAIRLRDMLVSRDIPLIINNYADLALAVEADGIHVGQSDMPVEVVRRIAGSKITVGLSITNMEEARTIQSRSEIDYVGIGPVFDATKTKADAAPGMGLEGFKQIRHELSDLPAIAIGGITLELAQSIISAGADGLAIVSAFSKAESPRIVAERFAAYYRPGTAT